MNLQSLLNSVQSVKGTNLPKITLLKGQIFLGKIMKLFPGDRAQVQLGGLQVHARLEAPLEAGKSYWLQVANAKGTPELKVLQSRDAPIEKNRSFRSLFEDLGLSPSKQREAVVRALVKENLPLSKEMIQKGGEWVKTAENIQAALDVIRQMASRQLPFTRVVFEALLSEREGTAVHERLNSLSKALTQSPESFPAADKLRELLSTLHLKPSESTETVKQSLQQAMERIGLSYENGLLQSKNSQLSEQKQLLTQIIAQTTSGDLQKQAQQLLAQLNSQTVMPPKVQKQIQHILSQAFARGDISSEPKIPQQPESLKPLLLQVLQQSGSGEVKQQAQALLSHITAQQLNAAAPFQTMVQLPVQFGSHQTDVTIKWEGQKDREGQLDADHCRILFYLELEHLRETAVDINIQKRFVTIRVYNEKLDLHSLIERFEPALKEGLESVGYHLSSLQQAEGQLPASGAQGKADPISGVDFRI
ncbi:MAG TPA: hypothetical protein VFK33_01165 [Bacillales bacterium]|nr:hypothetical protein [Bacillales bacterium]